MLLSWENNTQNAIWNNQTGERRPFREHAADNIEATILAVFATANYAP
jgi:hypothetical protein